MASAKYTPSLLPAETLETLFVVRERLLELLMQRVQQAAATGIRNHSLIVGPRGAGKTHMLALVAHRTQELIAKGARLQLSWLPEDPWVIVSYRAFLRAILAHAGMDTRPTLTDHEAEAALTQLVSAAGPIVVIVENLDQVFAQIGEAGQQRLRHLLQTTEHLLIVASTTRLDRALTSASEPFFHFFTTTHLAPFTVDEARLMLQTIARHRGDESLAERLGSDEATARLRTVAHLAGGQPRLWSALADALTADGVRDLIDTLLSRFDDLTPYYQEQLARLSPHQRLAIAELASADRPVHVAELSELSGVDPRSMAKTMSELREAGWVRPTSSPLAKLLDGRRTYYELSEPLARLSFQIKETRGEPLRLIVDFLTAWFDPADAERIDVDAYARRMIEAFSSDVSGSVIRTLSRLPSTRVPSVELLGRIDDALAELAAGSPQSFLELRTPLRVALETRMTDAEDPLANLGAVRRSIHEAALDEMGSVPHPLSESWIPRAQSLVDSSGIGSLDILLRWQLRKWDFAAAEAILTTMQLAGGAEAEVITSRLRLASAYSEAGHLMKSIPLLEQTYVDLERTLGPDHLDTLTCRRTIAGAYQAVGDLDSAIALYEQALADTERIFGSDHSSALVSRDELAGAYKAAGDFDRALPLYEQTRIEYERTHAEGELRLGSDQPATPSPRHAVAYAYEAAGDFDRAIALHERALADTERARGIDHPITRASRRTVAYAYQAADDFDRAIALHERALADTERLLGPDHPRTLGSRLAVALAYRTAGKLHRAITLHERALADTERLLGPDHPLTFLSRQAVALAYQAVGHLDKAVPLLKRNLADQERVLGPSHPDTVASRDHLAGALADSRGD